MPLKSTRKHRSLRLWLMSQSLETQTSKLGATYGFKRRMPRMFKIIQCVLAFFLVWAFMPIIEDLILVIARFFFRVGDILNLIPDIF